MAMLAFAQQPAWWSSRGIIKPMAEPMDYAMANQGQLKNFARAARDEMLQKQLIQEGHAIDLMVRAWIDTPDNALDFSAVNQGQLKSVATPFYDQLVLLHLRPEYPKYPWPVDSDADFVAVNIGQLKNVFTFAIPSLTLKALKYQQMVEAGMSSPFGLWVRLEQDGQPVQAAAVTYEVYQSAGGLLPSSNLQGVPQSTIQSTTDAQGYAGCQFRAPLQPAYCWIKATTAQIAPVWFLMIVGGGDGAFPSNPSGVDGVEYSEDSDGDGDTDAQELESGYDPKNPSSHSPDWTHWSLVTHLHHDYDQWYALNSREWQSNPNDSSTWHWFGFRTSLLQGVLYNPGPEDLGTTIKPPVSAYPVLNVSTMPPLLSPGWQEGGSAKWTSQNALPTTVVTEWYTSAGESDGVTNGQLIPSRSWSAQALKVEIKTARARPYAQDWVMLVQQGLTEKQVIETRTLTIPAGSSSTGPMIIYYPPVLEQYNSYSISLLPVDISVTKEGEEAAPEDGLVVKKTDTVRYRLSPGLPDAPLLLEDKIQWHWRILKWDGAYSDWTAYSNGQGHRFTAQPATTGIYEVKATVDGQDFFLKRKKDDPHSAKKKDENDCFGVVDEQWQINVRHQAKVNLGSVAYAKAEANSPLGAGDWKCNLFVAHKATDGGSTVPWINGGSYFIGTKYPPVANQWAGLPEPDGSYKSIPSWTLLPRETYPQPGWVIARSVTGGTGHTGIIDYDGAWIGAGEFEVNRKADIRNPFYNDEDPSTPLGPARFRKYTP